MQKLRLSPLLFSTPLVISTLLAIPALSWAAGSQTTTCSLNSQQRVIEVATSAKGCEVHYSKGTEQTKTLWSSARNEYCLAATGKVRKRPEKNA